MLPPEADTTRKAEGSAWNLRVHMSLLLSRPLRPLSPHCGVLGPTRAIGVFAAGGVSFSGRSYQPYDGRFPKWAAFMETSVSYGQGFW